MESSTNVERLIASAIKFYTLDSDYPMIMCGKRHCDIYESMWRASLNYLKSTAIQGFLTDKDRFVDRYEAKTIAIAAGQLIVPIEQTYAELFSEDVW